MSPEAWEISEGWKPLVKALVRLCEGHCVRNNLAFQINQVKEKFGTLRFYYTGGDDYVDGLVAMAEEMSEHTCEKCGSLGHLRTDLGWLLTLCDNHYNERKAEIEARRGR